MKNSWSIVIAVLLGSLATWNHALAAEQKVTLVLGGKMCDLYLPSVEAALKKVPGVTALDFKIVKGAVVVTADASVKPGKLEDAVNGVQGEGWYCEGKMK